MAGRSKAEIVWERESSSRRLPDLESGAMDYMMSKPSYLTDEGEHNLPHVMLYTRVEDGKDWGSGAAGSPVCRVPIGSSLRRNNPK